MPNPNIPLPGRTLYLFLAAMLASLLIGCALVAALMFFGCSPNQLLAIGIPFSVLGAGGVWLTSQKVLR